MNQEMKEEVKIDIVCNECKSEFQIKTFKVNREYIKDKSFGFSKDEFHFGGCIVCGSMNIDW